MTVEKKKPAEKIGEIKCWLCGSGKAKVSVSKAGLCCVTCNSCHAQTFARGAYADTMIRQGMRPMVANVAAAVDEIGREATPVLGGQESAGAKKRGEPAARQVDIEEVVGKGAGAPVPVEEKPRRGFGFFQV